MSVQKCIMDALRGLGHPIYPDLYNGEAERYFTFNIADDRGFRFSDDEPEVHKVSVQIHYFLPEQQNYIRDKNEIRNKLFERGFTYPVITVLLEKDTEKRHIIFECEIEEEREW